MTDRREHWQVRNPRPYNNYDARHPPPVRRVVLHDAAYWAHQHQQQAQHQQQPQPQQHHQYYHHFQQQHHRQQQQQLLHQHQHQYYDHYQQAQQHQQQQQQHQPKPHPVRIASTVVVCSSPEPLEEKEEGELSSSDDEPAPPPRSSLRITGSALGGSISSPRARSPPRSGDRRQRTRGFPPTAVPLSRATSTPVPRVCAIVNKAQLISAFTAQAPPLDCASAPSLSVLAQRSSSELAAENAPALGPEVPAGVPDACVPFQVSQQISHIEHTESHIGLQTGPAAATSAVDNSSEHKASPKTSGSLKVSTSVLGESYNQGKKGPQENAVIPNMPVPPSSGMGLSTTPAEADVSALRVAVPRPVPSSNVPTAVVSASSTAQRTLSTPSKVSSVGRQQESVGARELKSLVGSSVPEIPTRTVLPAVIPPQKEADSFLASLCIPLVPAAVSNPPSADYKEEAFVINFDESTDSDGENKFLAASTAQGTTKVAGRSYQRVPLQMIVSHGTHLTSNSAAQKPEMLQSEIDKMKKQIAAMEQKGKQPVQNSIKGLKSSQSATQPQQFMSSGLNGGSVGQAGDGERETLRQTILQKQNELEQERQRLERHRQGQINPAKKRGVPKLSGVAINPRKAAYVQTRGNSLTLRDNSMGSHGEPQAWAGQPRPLVSAGHLATPINPGSHLSKNPTVRCAVSEQRAVVGNVLTTPTQGQQIVADVSRFSGHEVQENQSPLSAKQKRTRAEKLAHDIRRLEAQIGTVGGKAAVSAKAVQPLKRRQYVRDPPDHIHAKGDAAVEVVQDRPPKRLRADVPDTRANVTGRASSHVGALRPATHQQEDASGFRAGHVLQNEAERSSSLATSSYIGLRAQPPFDQQLLGGGTHHSSIGDAVCNDRTISSRQEDEVHRPQQVLSSEALRRNATPLTSAAAPMLNVTSNRPSELNGSGHGLLASSKDRQLAGIHEPDHSEADLLKDQLLPVPRGVSGPESNGHSQWQEYFLKLQAEEDAVDRQLDEAQDSRHRCEAQERAARRAYREAQASLQTANRLCDDLHQRREVLACQVRAAEIQHHYAARAFLQPPQWPIDMTAFYPAPFARPRAEPASHHVEDSSQWRGPLMNNQLPAPRNRSPHISQHRTPINIPDRVDMAAMSAQISNQHIGMIPGINAAAHGVGYAGTERTYETNSTTDYGQKGGNMSTTMLRQIDGSRVVLPTEPQNTLPNLQMSSTPVCSVRPGNPLEGFRRGQDVSPVNNISRFPAAAVAQSAPADSMDRELLETTFGTDADGVLLPRSGELSSAPAKNPRVLQVQDTQQLRTEEPALALQSKPVVGSGDRSGNGSANHAEHDPGGKFLALRRQEVHSSLGNPGHLTSLPEVAGEAVAVNNQSVKKRIRKKGEHAGRAAKSAKARKVGFQKFRSPGTSTPPQGSGLSSGPAYGELDRITASDGATVTFADPCRLTGMYKESSSVAADNGGDQLDEVENPNINTEVASLTRGGGSDQLRASGTDRGGFLTSLGVEKSGSDSIISRIHEKPLMDCSIKEVGICSEGTQQPVNLSSEELACHIQSEVVENHQIGLGASDHEDEHDVVELPVTPLSEELTTAQVTVASADFDLNIGNEVSSEGQFDEVVRAVQDVSEDQQCHGGDMEGEILGGSSVQGADEMRSEANGSATLQVGESLGEISIGSPASPEVALDPESARQQDIVSGAEAAVDHVVVPTSECDLNLYVPGSSLNVTFGSLAGTDIQLLHLVTAKQKVMSEDAGSREMCAPPYQHPCYRSPLLNFRSYRLSPWFKYSLESITWSNAIDCFKILCNYELRGACKSVQCKSQHMRDYRLDTHGVLHQLRNYKEARMSQANHVIPGNMEEVVDVSYSTGENKGALTDVETDISLVLESVHKDGSCIVKPLVCPDRHWTSYVGKVPVFRMGSHLKWSLDSRPQPFVKLGPFQSVLLSYSASRLLPVGVPCLFDKGGQKSLFKARIYDAPRWCDLTDMTDKQLRVEGEPNDVESSLELALDAIHYDMNMEEVNKNSALYYLSRALEANSSSCVLWIVYLSIFYSNDGIDKDDLFHHAVIHSNSYELWRLLIDSRPNLSQRLDCYKRALSSLGQGEKSAMNEKTQSPYLLDLSLQMLYCMLISGNIELALSWIDGLIADVSAECLPPGDRSTSHVLIGLTLHDACILWVSCAYVAAYSELPPDVVLHFGCKQELPFGLQWMSQESVHLDRVKRLLQTAASAGAGCVSLHTCTADDDVANLSRQALAVNYVRCLAVLVGGNSALRFCRQMLNLHPTSLELVVECAALEFLLKGMEQGLNVFDEAVLHFQGKPGIHRLWNQYVGHALKWNGKGAAINILAKYSSWERESCKPTTGNGLSVGLSSSSNGVLNDSGYLRQIQEQLSVAAEKQMSARSDNIGNRMSPGQDSVFALLNLALLQVLTGETSAAQATIDKSVEIALKERDAEHCWKEFVVFLYHTCEPESECGLFGENILELLDRCFAESRLASKVEPLSQIADSIKKRRVRSFVKDLLGPPPADYSLFNDILFATFGHTMLPVDANSFRRTASFAEGILEIMPGNVAVALALRRLVVGIYGGSASVRAQAAAVWANSLLANALVNSCPTAPEAQWLEAVNFIHAIGEPSASKEFCRHALKAYPFSVKLAKFLDS